ncbi:UPF0324 membrane protein [Fulvitalea axinellae]|uniref:UPF0324 membrane protein n=1 Tax=Fulvitalea axinellae TaxID=1182444 RepID=A0AAU9D146_9BACT|nr:UPF0324 membrane protein [Fulvitalea axinellae]
MMRRIFEKEDYRAIVVGAFFLLVALGYFGFGHYAEFRPEIERLNATLKKESAQPFRTLAWEEAHAEKASLKAKDSPLGKVLGGLTSKPMKWTDNPLEAFYTKRKVSSDKIKKAETLKLEQDKAYAEAKTAEQIALAAHAKGAGNDALDQTAVKKIASWKNAHAEWKSSAKKAKPGTLWQFDDIMLWGIILTLILGLGCKLAGESFSKFAAGFAGVFGLAVLAYLFSQQAEVKALGIGYAAWAIGLGMLFGNTLGTPEWIKKAARTEYFIKTGLILLGAEILFGKVMAIGLPGMFVAWVVTPVVLVTTFIFGQKVLKIGSKSLNMTISADMSVCGVSAAIATASACKAKKEELTLAVGLSMAFTSIMMVAMPAFIRWIGMPEVLGGAWLGGTLDATGAVVAAGAFLGDTAMNVAATIKMIQNVLIGFVAFFVTMYWTTKVERENDPTAEKVGLSEVWKRFPKFLLGFIGASLIFSSLYEWLGQDMGYSLIDQGVIRSFTKNVRGWLFCLAFVSIGLSTDFRELRTQLKGGKPLILYICGQAFNIVLTLLAAYVMFYLVFPEITETL